MLLKTEFSHDFILTKFRRRDAKPDFIYMYVFTDIMLTLYFGLQMKIDWIGVGLGNFKGESERGLEDMFCNIFQR